MTKGSVEELIGIETRLNRSLVACVVAVVGNLVWTRLLVTSRTTPGLSSALVTLGILVVQVACYVWFAISAGAAARVLGEARWKYVVWILVAPFLSLVPIPVVSTIIGVSPLSIKFLLGGQLAAAIRERALED